MSGRSLRTAGLAAGAVGVGMLVGAVAFGPRLGFAAQDPETDTDVSSICQRFLGDGPIAEAATAIGIRPSELVAALRDGATIAQVAEAHGVDPDDVVDAIVADQRDRLERAVRDGVMTRDEADRVLAELEQHVTDLVEGNLPMPDLGRMPLLGHPDLWGFADGPLAAAAGAIGIRPAELLSELRDGRTIAEVAADHGVDVAAVVDAIVGALGDRLDAAVEDGWLTQAEADELAAELRDTATAIVNGELDGIGPFPMPGFGWFGGGDWPGHWMFGHGVFGHGMFGHDATTAESSAS